MVARPVAQTPFQGLEDAAPSGSPFLPLPSEGSLRGERLVFVFGVVGRNPGAGQTDLEIGQRLVDQRPDGGVETHASGEAGTRRGMVMAETDVTVQTLGMLADHSGLGAFGIGRTRGWGVILCESSTSREEQ